MSEARFDRIDAQLQESRERFDGVDAELRGFRGRFDGVDAELRGFRERFDGVDAELRVSRERFDGVDARLDGVDQRLDRLDVSQVALGARISDEIGTLGRQMRVLHEEVLERIAALSHDGPTRREFDRARRDDRAAVEGRLRNLEMTVKDHSKEIKVLKKLS